MSTDDEQLKKLGFTSLAETTRGRVVITEAVEPEFEALEEHVRGRLTRIMELWCDGRPLTETMFNGNEGRAKGSNILLMAFKGFKVRLYGFQQTLLKRKTFIVADIDSAKKQNKADQGILKRAKARVTEISKGLNNG